MTADQQPSIHDLFDAVRQHPAFVFGTVFVAEDFPGGKVPEGFRAQKATDALGTAGNEYIELTVGPLDEH